MREPNTAPPENVELIAPIIGLVLSVLKKSWKFGESITGVHGQIYRIHKMRSSSSRSGYSPSVMTPESYPNRNDL